MRDWAELDIDQGPFDDHGSCVSFKHEPNDPTPVTLLAEIKKSRIDRAVRDALGPDNVRLLKSIGVFDADAERVEAHLMLTDEDEMEVLGVDS